MRDFQDYMHRLAEKPQLEGPPGEEEEVEAAHAWLRRISTVLDQALESSRGNLVEQLTNFRRLISGLYQKVEQAEQAGVFILAGDEQVWRDSLTRMVRRWRALQPIENPSSDATRVSVVDTEEMPDGKSMLTLC